SILAVSGAIYLNLREQSLADSRVQQQTNIGVAATILERRISGSVLQWNEDGTMATFQSWAIPPFYDNEIIDSVTRVTKQDATIYVVDPQSGDMVSKTTSLIGPDGESRLTDLHITPDSAVFTALTAGETFIGHMPIDGVD